MNVLGPELDAGTPVVMLEPSCYSVFRDEVNGLFPNSVRAHKLMEHTVTFAEFLEKESAGNHVKFPTLKREAIVHGHCHHKAIMRLKEEKTVMDKKGPRLSAAKFRLLWHGRFIRLRARKI